MISKTKRDSFEILADILKAIGRANVRKTAIVYRANLNYERIGRYLELLLTTGLIEAADSANSKGPYRMTAKGREFIIEYDHLVDSLGQSAIAETAAVQVQT